MVLHACQHCDSLRAVGVYVTEDAPRPTLGLTVLSGQWTATSGCRCQQRRQRSVTRDTMPSTFPDVTGHSVEAEAAFGPALATIIRSSPRRPRRFHSRPNRDRDPAAARARRRASDLRHGTTPRRREPRRTALHPGAAIEATEAR